MSTDAWSSWQLYKATKFPTEWVKFKDLHRNHYVDPTIVFYRGTWWAFANIEQNQHMHLHILFSDSPLGPWESHPNNCFIEKYAEDKVTPVSHACFGGQNVQIHHKTGPLRRNLIGVRTGGMAFVYNDKLYRMVQNSARSYGDSLDMYEVVSISKDKPLWEVLVPEFRANMRLPENIGSFF